MLPTALPGGGGARGGGASTAYRNCLSDHGATLNGSEDLATSDPKVAAALKACAALRPTSVPASSPTAAPAS